MSTTTARGPRVLLHPRLRQGFCRDMMPRSIAQRRHGSAVARRKRQPQTAGCCDVRRQDRRKPGRELPRQRSAELDTCYSDRLAAAKISNSGRPET